MRALIPLLMAVPLLAQDPAATDLVLLTTREEIRGKLQSIDEAGTVTIGEAGRERRIVIEDLQRVRFAGVAGAPASGPARLILNRGLSFGARVDTLRDGRMRVAAAFGTFDIPVAEIKSVLLAPLEGPMPQLKEQPQDAVLWASAAKPKEVRAAQGALTELTADHVKIGEETIPRAQARLILMKPAKLAPAPVGWFTRVEAANGDRLVGTLRSLSDREVAVFCPPLGAVTLARTAVREIELSPVARMTSGHYLVCDQTGVREFDREGREIWNYGRNVAYAWSARRLDNGNILIANTNMGQVIEVRPRERSGGEVVWSLEGLNYPYDARKLENGNVLIAEYYGSRVFEVNPRDNSIAWELKPFRNPITAERLSDGSTLICTSDQVVEVDAKGATTWKAKVPGLQPWRASRLESGNTLIVEQAKGQVIEIDRNGSVVWKREGLHRPYQALRLDDGDTMILEQGRGQAVVYDSAGREVRTIEKLSYPINITTW